MHVYMLGCRGIPATYGGVERVVEEIAVLLAKKGHQVSVLCRSHYSPKIKKFKGVNIVRLPTLNQKHFEMILHTLISIVFLSFKKCDIVHIHSVDPAILTPLLRLRHRVVATSHGQAYRREKWGRTAKALSKIAEKVFIKAPNVCTAVSKVLVSYYFEKYGREVEYIPNGVELQQQESSSYIDQFGIEKNNYILFVGRLIPTKGPKILIEAFKRINTDIKLVILGGSSHTDEYEKNLRKEANENILFLGYQYGEVLKSLYKNCKLFVFPSQIEGLPIVLLEALSFLKPVIFSDIPENMEVANGIGIPFKNGDVQDLSDKLNYAIKNPKMLNSFVSKIKERLREEYNWDTITNKYIKIYEDAIKKS